MEIFDFQMLVNVELYYCGHGWFCFRHKFCIDKLTRSLKEVLEGK